MASVEFRAAMRSLFGRECRFAAEDRRVAFDPQPLNERRKDRNQVVHQDSFGGGAEPGAKVSCLKDDLVVKEKSLPSLSPRLQQQEPSTLTGE